LVKNRCISSLNDVVARAFASAGIPVVKEPAGLCRTGGKCPDGMTNSLESRNAFCVGCHSNVYYSFLLHWFLHPRGRHVSRNCSYAEDGQIQ